MIPLCSVRQGLPVAPNVRRKNTTPRMALMSDEKKSLADAEESLGSNPQPSDSQADRVLRLVHWTSTASRHLRRRLADVGEMLGLSDTELLVLWLCSGGDRVQVDLAGVIGISPAQMSGMVERLRSRGLVAMHRLAMDRRRQVWRTSAAGQTLLVRAAQHLSALSGAIASGLSASEQQAAQTLCQRLAEVVAVSARRPSTKTAADHHELQRASKEAA
jgi:DNA-binding MarR family transcriptional regulator